MALKFLNANSIKIAVLFILIGGLAWKTDFTILASHFSVDTLIAGLLIQPLVVLSFILSALRFGVFVGLPPFSVLLPFKAVILSYGMNLFLPGKLSELLKVSYLKDHASIPLSSGLAALFLERLMDVLMVCALVVMSLMFFYIELDRMAIILALSALATFLMVLLVKDRLAQFILNIPWPGHALKHFMRRFVAHAIAHIRGIVIIKGIIYSVIFWATSAASVAVFLDLVGPIHVGLSGALAVLIAASVGGAVQVLPGGFGTYEAAVVLVLKSHGYGYEDALYTALVLHASHILLAVSCALAIASIEGVGIRTLFQRTMALIKA